MISGIIFRLNIIMLQRSESILIWNFFENVLNMKYLRIETIDK